MEIRLLVTEVRWGAVGLGTVAGLLLMLVAGLVGTLSLSLLARVGLATGETVVWAVLSLSVILGEFAGGYVAGRLAAEAPAGFQGSLAALGVYGVFATVSLFGGSPAGIMTLVVFSLLAAVIGFAGGALGGR